MKNSKFSGSCEDAEKLNLSEQSSDCELNLDEQNSLKEQNSAASNLNDEGSAAATKNSSDKISTTALNLNDVNSKATLNLNDQNLSNQSFAAIGIASMSNLDGENSSTGATALNFKNKNSATADIIATSKTMAGAVKTEAAMSAVEAKMTKTVQTILRLQG